jgi:hypothetical protein
VSDQIPVNAKNADDVARILKAFLEPFAADEIKYKPAKVKDNRCLALAYIDARLVLDRLDEVLGLNGWKDEYTVLPGGTEVECRLSIRIAGEWITKADVGGESEQPDGGDRMKAAYSDALKRAAVKFGIGRFLYRLPQQWMDYDPVRKCIIRPGTQASKPATKATQPAPVKVAAPMPQQPKSTLALPANGLELDRRLREYESKLVAQKLCQAGSLIAYVTQCGVRAGYTASIKDWAGPAIHLAAEVVKEFETTMRKQPAPAKT